MAILQAYRADYLINMRVYEYDVTQRLSELSNIPTQRLSYLEGLFNIVDSMCRDMRDLMAEEDRCFGIVRSYLSSIRSTFSDTFKDVVDEDLDLFGRIMYVLKPFLQKDLYRLIRKGLSPADSIICLIRKVLIIMDNSCKDDYYLKRKIKIVLKIINKLYDNIRNKAKEDTIFILSNTIHSCIEEQKIGRAPFKTFSIISENEPKSLPNSGLCIGDTSGIVNIDLWNENQ